MRSMVDWQLLHEALLTMEGQVIVRVRGGPDPTAEVTRV